MPASIGSAPTAPAPRTAPRRLAFAAGALLAAAIAGPAAAQQASPALGACDRTTAFLADACRREVPAEKSEALALCANRRDPAARARCVARAEDEADEALETCAVQAAARAAVCRALGQAPYDPVIRPADFTTRIDNPYLPLVPGTTFVYRGGDEVVTVEVTRRTVRIRGVTCVVVKDTAVEDGRLKEQTEDYYAQDLAGNVWYFGEATAEFANGVSVSTDGSWIAGVDGAKPGIVMPADPRAGDAYRQEFALTEAEDLARVITRAAAVQVPFGSFSRTVKTFDWTPLDPDARENKFYARGVGLVLAIDRATGDREELVRVIRP